MTSAMGGERFVYFLRPVGQRGPVKIGTSSDPIGRLASCMRWSPVPLEVIATIPGGFDLEVRFHTLFQDDHSHGEWFHGSERMEQVVAAINSGFFNVAALPAPTFQQASLSDIGRQNRGLRNQVSRRFTGDHRRMPEWLRKHYKALSLPAGPEREQAVAAVKRFLAVCESCVGECASGCARASEAEPHAEHRIAVLLDPTLTERA